MFLDEIETIISMAKPIELKNIWKEFTKQLAKCISSPHFEVRN